MFLVKYDSQAHSIEKYAVNILGGEGYTQMLVKYDIAVMFGGEGYTETLVKYDIAIILGREGYTQNIGEI